MSGEPNQVSAPGPGFWTRDPSHMSEPPSLSTAELLFPAFEAGLAAGMARYGGLLERLKVADVAGWMYTRARPVGAPEKPGGAPPRLVFKLLLKLHPALRARSKAAQEAIALELWRRDAEAWFASGREALSRRLRELQSRIDVRTVAGNASFPAVLEAAGIADTDMLVALTSSDEVNMVACEIAHALYRTPTKIARIRAPEYTAHDRLFSAGMLAVMAGGNVTSLNPAERRQAAR